MVELDLHAFDGGEQGNVEVSDQLLTEPFNRDVLHRAVRTYQTNARAGTASTKDRSKVKGSNRKPWRQKGTGRARHGSRQSPLWAGGGITFGPKPKEYNLGLPRKMKVKAIKSALSTRYREDRLAVIDKLDFEEPNTQQGVALLGRLDLDGKVLIIISEQEDNYRVNKSFANIPRVSCLPAANLVTYPILKNERILATRQAIDRLSERLLDDE